MTNRGIPLYPECWQRMILKQLKKKCLLSWMLASEFFLGRMSNCLCFWRNASISDPEVLVICWWQSFREESKLRRLGICSIGERNSWLLKDCWEDRGGKNHVKRMSMTQGSWQRTMKNLLVSSWLRGLSTNEYNKILLWTVCKAVLDGTASCNSWLSCDIYHSHNVSNFVGFSW